MNQVIECDTKTKHSRKGLKVTGGKLEHRMEMVVSLTVLYVWLGNSVGVMS